MSDILKQLERFRAAGRRIVFTNGCFDILHVGHVRYLAEAKRLGDVLVVGLNSDASVRRLKGKSRPVNSLEARREVLLALRSVDLVISFEEDTPIALIDTIRPDVHVKGGDYVATSLPEYEVVKRHGGDVVILPFVPGYSTTLLLEKGRG